MREGVYLLKTSMFKEKKTPLFPIEMNNDKPSSVVTFEQYLSCFAYMSNNKKGRKKLLELQLIVISFCNKCLTW